MSLSAVSIAGLVTGTGVPDVADQIAATNLSRTLRAFTSAAASGCGSALSAVTFRGSAAMFSGVLAGAVALDGVDQISAADNSPMAEVRAGAVACCAALFECVPSCATDGIDSISDAF
jgi:hypothetical protein